MRTFGTTYYNELEAFPCQVIRNNIQRGRLPEGWVDQRDIRHVTADDLVGYRQLHLFAGIGVAAYACRIAGLPEQTNILTGGFPCKNLAACGDGTGIGTRNAPTQHSGLFWPMLDIICYVRPDWLVLENSPSLRTRGADTVLSELEMLGYTCWPTVVGAWATGAPHERDRVWIVAHSERVGRQAGGRVPGNEGGSQLGRTEPREQRPFVADSYGQQHGCHALDSIQPRGDTVTAGRASRVGVGQADAHGAGWGKRRGAVSVEQEQLSTQCRSHRKYEWPSRPGEVQHPREAPRLVLGERLWNHGDRLRAHLAAQLGKDIPATEEVANAGTERGVGRATHGNAGRLAGRPAEHRRDALKALGNAWVPWCAVPIFQWISQFEVNT